MKQVSLTPCDPHGLCSPLTISIMKFLRLKILEVVPPPAQGFGRDQIRISCCSIFTTHLIFYDFYYPPFAATKVNSGAPFARFYHKNQISLQYVPKITVYFLLGKENHSAGINHSKMCVGLNVSNVIYQNTDFAETAYAGA